MCFFCRHVRTVTLMTMHPIPDDMLTTLKICVAVAKCERILRCDTKFCLIDSRLWRRNHFCWSITYYIAMISQLLKCFTFTFFQKLLPLGCHFLIADWLLTCSFCIHTKLLPPATEYCTPEYYRGNDQSNGNKYATLTDKDELSVGKGWLTLHR